MPSEPGYVLAFGNCLSCGNLFAFNPRFVPSLRVDGERKPVCQPCMDAGNAKRVALGLDPHPIHPEAYRALPEEEL